MQCKPLHTNYMFHINSYRFKEEKKERKTKQNKIKEKNKKRERVSNGQRERTRE